MGAVSSMSTPRIARIEVQAPMTLLVEWRDGRRTKHDVSARIMGEDWAAPLREAAVFRSVRVKDAGLQIVWPGTDVAFSAQGLWEDAHPRDTSAKWMAPDDFVSWMQEMDFTFARAADALETSPRMLKCYAAGTHAIPKTVWLACMHLAAERSRSRRPHAVPRRAGHDVTRKARIG
jgi:hypothetical protein